jgi:predicted dehydrogenase
MTKENRFNRRKFIGEGAMIVGATSALPLYSFTNKKGGNPSTKTKLAIVGTGSRGITTWGKPVVDAYSDQVEFVALCDINPKRMAAAKVIMGVDLKMYEAKDFELMIQETKPDVVIVTTTDGFHEKYIIRAMELGCDVISEKPIAIEAEQCQRIADAEVRTGRKIRVGFNDRHTIDSMEIKKIMMSGELGKIIAIDFNEYLDTSHGADYFRRWHGKKAYSGTLLLHKASHHFDIANWFVDADPVDVQAVGKLSFYGHNNPFRGRNCRTCSHTAKCRFYWDMTKDKEAMNMYGNCEDVDNYYRDGCVWDNDIDIYDTSSVHVNYENGTQLTYTMQTLMPYEGQFIGFTCENGRLDVRLNKRQPWEAPETEFRLTKDRETTKYWTMKAPAGGHGGSDERLKNAMFLPPEADPLGCKAGSRAGIMSSLVGIAARQSIETGQKVKIADLIKFPTVWRG